MRITRIAALSSVLWMAASSSSAQEIRSKDFPASRIFSTTNIWTVHFKFTEAEWAAMEPKGGGGMPGFFGGGGPGGGRPPEGGRGFGPPEGFGTGMFLAPALFQSADVGADGKMSKTEFQTLGEKLFQSWDKDRTGKLSLDHVRDGITSLMEKGRGGPPGGRPSPEKGMLQGADGKRNGLSSAMGIDFDYVHADLEFQGIPFKDVAVRYKGNGTFMESRGSLKRSLKVDLNQFVKGQKLAGETKLNFHNGVTDPSWMNEVLALGLFRDAGVPSPRTAYAKVYVTVPGKHDDRFFGLYSLVESVDKRFLEERRGSKKGALFKPVTPSPFSDLGDDWSAYNQTYDPKTDLDDSEKQRVIAFCKLVTHASDVEFGAKAGDFLDLDEVARFMAVTVYLSSSDSILGAGQNYYVFLDPKTDRFSFLPWDHDHSFGQFPMGGGNPVTLSIHHPWQGDIRFLDRLFKVPAFHTLYLKRMEEFSRTLFRPERFQQQVDELAAVLRPVVEEESAEQLAKFDRAVAGDASASGGFGGFAPSVKPIKGFVGPRTREVIDQLSGASKGTIPTEMGFGGPGGPGGPRGPGGPGGPGGPQGFGLGTLLGERFLGALDSDKDGSLSREEFSKGFAKWFDVLAGPDGAALTQTQLRDGLNKEVPFFPGGGFPGPEGGPTPDRP
jgi:spore coat protein H